MSAHGWQSVAFFSSLLTLQPGICAGENSLKKKKMPSSSQGKKTQTKTAVSAAAAGILFPSHSGHSLHQ